MTLNKTVLRFNWINRELSKLGNFFIA